MDRLGLLETFACAVDEGSLNRTAKRLGITQSAVSQQIKQLETLFGEQLLHRTSKGVQTTRAGELVVGHARSIQSGFEILQTELTDMKETVSGTFRLSVSNILGRAIVGPMLIDLGTPYPDLNIVMKLEDRLVDVVREGYDLAIRSGRLGDTDGFGRKIAALKTVLFANPAYLDKVGRPETIEDLMRLKMVQHNEDQTQGFIPIIKDGKEIQAPVRGGFTADDPDLILQAVNNCTGFARAPRFMIAVELANGTYEQVLPAYSNPDKPVFAVYPTRHAAGRGHDIILQGVVDRLEAIQAEFQQVHPRPYAITA
ncbi:LysR family transcriptional regulator [Parasedimentitalea maritima]|uniref:LysR family transcriptional regulator n=1 Tax=Parasedimentitalea maritima TaxID=2578117 RepID=A0ABY2UVM8_9RHOB|nr:LysR family transcriptional regulator [Zongyanglinia marina]TLP64434.1 LysR family transcriptional regulator [Zongyanglinia marina]